MARATRSGDEPAGKPTSSFTVLVGHGASGGSFLELFWAVAQVDSAHAAIKSEVRRRMLRGILRGMLNPVNQPHIVAHAGAGTRNYAYSASVFFIFFIAATSIWRMRSALTPYSAAS